MFFSEGDKVRLSSALKNAKSYEDVRKIIDKPNHEIKVRISFFGVSKISIKGFSFSTSVDNLAYKIERMVEEKFDFTEKERSEGIIIASKIDFFYSEIEKQEKKLNCITKLFRNIYRHLNSTQTFWQQYQHLMFKLYTKNQYEKKFGHQPLDSDPHWSVSDQPDRWYAPEKKL